MSKHFEKLIEYVIADDEAKARELFHQIVVEKSREIYENLMAEEFGEDEGEDLINDVEADETGFSPEEGDEFGDEFGDEEGDEFGDEEGDEFGDEEGAADLEDRVVDLEDQLDELMAEFDALMAGEEGEEVGDDEVDFDLEGGEEGELDGEDEFGPGLTEEVSLKAVPKPSNADTADNKKSVSLANSGKKGVGTAGDPVKTDTTAENGRSAPKANVNTYGAKGPQEAASGAFKSKAPSAKTGEESGVSDKSVVRK
jgi:hypothetical protein